MALKREQLIAAIDAAPNENHTVRAALSIVMPVLRFLWDDMPWWKKVFVGLKALIAVIDEVIYGDDDDED